MTIYIRKRDAKTIVFVSRFKFCVENCLFQYKFFPMHFIIKVVKKTNNQETISKSTNNYLQIKQLCLFELTDK